MVLLTEKKKIQSQPESRELFSRNVKDSKLGRWHLSDPEKTARKGREGVSGYTPVCNKEGRQSEHQR